MSGMSVCANQIGRLPPCAGLGISSGMYLAAEESTKSHHKLFEPFVYSATWMLWTAEEK